MPKVDLKADARIVESRFKPGDRLMCVRDGKMYQIGVKAGQTEFWMLSERDNTKGKVRADSILVNFNRAVA